MEYIIVIEELAEELGVSPIPIRGAIHQLQAEGFLEIEPYVSIRLTEIHDGLANKVFAPIEASQVLARREDCRQFGDADLKEMKHTLTAPDVSITNPNRFSQENERYYIYFCQWPQTPIVKKTMVCAKPLPLVSAPLSLGYVRRIPRSRPARTLADLRSVSITKRR